MTFWCHKIILVVIPTYIQYTMTLIFQFSISVLGMFLSSHWLRSFLACLKICALPWKWFQLHNLKYLDFIFQRCMICYLFHSLQYFEHRHVNMYVQYILLSLFKEYFTKESFQELISLTSSDAWVKTFEEPLFKPVLENTSKNSGFDKTFQVLQN